MDENNNNIVQEILHDLFSSMETLETQNTAILQCLKDKGIALTKNLPPIWSRRETPVASDGVASG